MLRYDEQLKYLGVSDKQLTELRNGSFEVFIDDEGTVQKVIFRKRRRKREGEDLKVVSQNKSCKAQVDIDSSGTIQNITYETVWTRNS